MLCSTLFEAKHDIDEFKTGIFWKYVNVRCFCFWMPLSKYRDFYTWLQERLNDLAVASSVQTVGQAVLGLVGRCKNKRPIDASIKRPP